MTRILILQGHPDAAQRHLCHAIADSYRDAAIAAGHSVELIDIGALDIPFLRSKSEWENEALPPFVAAGQAAVDAADHIVLIYPLWMGDMPALVKAWFEQVLRQSFAFDLDGIKWTPRLKGKSARVMVTMGMPALAYRWFFFAHSLRSLDRNILRFCGIRPVAWTICGNAEDPSGKAQKGFIETAAKLGRAGR